MNEVFDSEYINVEYRKDDNIVLVVLKGKVKRDSYRTPMMHAADMVMRHSCKVMRVDFRADPGISENDIIWSKKVLLANLKNKASENPSAQETESAEDKFASMTREQALEYMGLDADADIKVIDDRFWQMSKNYRGKDDPESMEMEDEISAVYDIASGRRDSRIKEEERRRSEPKYFGRYKSDWKNIIHYNWKNLAFGMRRCDISAIAVIIGVATNAEIDCSVVVFGHMYLGRHIHA